jgi:adenylosuccinate lyase
VAEVLDRGGTNDLLDHLAADPAFAAVGAQALRAELDATRYVGRAPAQVQEFLAETIDPLLKRLQPFHVTDDAGVTV